jgi:hypothetical protein
MNDPKASNTAASDECDAAQAAGIGGGIADPSNPGSTSALADAYEWLVDATSAAIESIANRLR